MQNGRTEKTDKFYLQEQTTRSMKCSVSKIDVRVKSRKLQRLGCLERISENRISKKVAQVKPRLKKRRPRRTMIFC